MTPQSGGGFFEQLYYSNLTVRWKYSGGIMKGSILDDNKILAVDDGPDVLIGGRETGGNITNLAFEFTTKPGFFITMCQNTPQCFWGDDGRPLPLGERERV